MGDRGFSTATLISTNSALPLLWNYLTFSDGLLTVDEVARQFEFNSLQRAVSDVRDSLEGKIPRIWPKSSHLGPPEKYSQQRYEWIFPDSSPGASPAVDLAAFDQRAFEPPMMSLGLR